jgi:hypothetical protein
MLTKIVDRTADSIITELDGRSMFNGIDDETRDDIEMSIRFLVRDGITACTEALKEQARTDSPG